MVSKIEVDEISNQSGDQDSGLDLSTNDEVKVKIAGSNTLTFKANEIENVSGDLTIDVAGDIKLDADGSEIFFADGGTDFLKIQNDSGNAQIRSLVSDGDVQFIVNDGGSNIVALTIDSSAGGIILIGTTDTNPGNNTSGSGIVLNGSDGKFSSAVDGSEVMVLNRMSSDGTVLLIRQDGNSEGSISVSGATVSYEGFSGLHQSSGILTSTPKGTVVSTRDELDVYASGETKEGQTRADHAKVEVSDTVGDSAVYGVVSRFDDNDKVFVASVGIGSVRVTGACSKGDLLESNGDGTAKVQDDDIVRSKTIGKVTIGNSDTKEKLVSCVLYCG